MREGYPDFLKKLNDDQFEAAVTIEGPQLILAGAGSGKTTTLVNRLAYMVESGIDAKKILLLTFTNAAADNMQARAERLADVRCKNALCCTFHSFCVKLLRMFSKEAGIKEDFTVITGPDITSVMNIVKSRNGYSSIKEIPATKQIASAYSYCRNTGKDWAEFVEDSIPDSEEVRRAVMGTTSGYEEYKSENGLLDYDDLLFETAKLLKNEQVRSLCEAMYPYVMVDEYQDTNHVQEEIVLALTKSRRNLCVVGDDYQSIYAFRGADVSNILEFPKKMTGCKVTRVLTNYRSTEQILEIPNKMMDMHADFGFKKEMVSGIGEGKYPTLYIPKSEEEESQLMFEKVKDWLSKNVPPSEIAVLTRASKDTARLEAMLTKEGIQFVKRGGAKFFERQAIVDMLSLFRCVVNATDEIAYFNALDIIPGIGDAYANKIIAGMGTEEFLSGEGFENKQFYEDLKAFRAFVSIMKHSVTCKGMEELFDIASKYYVKLRTKKIVTAKVADEGVRTEMALELKEDEELIEVLKDIAKGYKSIPEFLDGCVLDSKDPDDEARCVTISTIHSAKGMEWDCVWVRGLSDGCLPKVDEDEEEQAEDLRCLYVALTRPRKELVMSAPQESLIKGQSTPTGLTRFLKGVVTKDNCCIKISEVKEPKVYLSVAYRNKDIAKKYGARWDGAAKLWYIPSAVTGENRERLVAMFGR